MHSLAESALDSWRQWIPRPTSRPQLSGILADGLTNQNFKLATSHGDAVLRLPHPQSELLGIDRQREQQIIEALRDKRINTEVWYHNSDTGVMVSQFVHGKAYTADQLNFQQKEAVHKLINRYQSIRVNLPKFDYAGYLQEYRKRILANETLSGKQEAEWQSFFPKLLNWQSSDWEPVLCHHDLKGKNLINTRDEWLLVDWEYAAMGHPALDLLSCNIKPLNLDQSEEKILLRLIEWMERFWFVLQKHSHRKTHFEQSEIETKVT